MVLARLVLIGLLVVGCASPACGCAPTPPPPSHGCGFVPPSPPPNLPSAACATKPARAPAPTRTRHPPGMELPGPGTALDPGRYTKSSFEPAVTFEVAEGWVAQQVASGFFDIEDEPGSPDVIAVQFANVLGADTAGDALDNILRQPDLRFGPTEKFEMAGSTALQVVVETTDPPDTDPPIFRQVLTGTAGPLSISSARRLQVTLLDVDNGVLAILVGGSIANWEQTLRRASPVVESVTIGD